IDEDEDGLDADQEAQWGSSDQDRDSDDDGHSDSTEVFGGSNPSEHDTHLDHDGDQLLNLDESLLWTNPFDGDTDRDGLPDDIDEVPISRAFLDFGDPLFSRDDAHSYVFPPWLAEVRKSGGVWQPDAPSAWHVPATDKKPAMLMLNLSPQPPTGTNLTLELSYHDHANAELSVYLATPQGILQPELFGNLLTGTGEDRKDRFEIPLADHPEATSILLVRTRGAVTIYSGLIYIDEDEDGLDADQEAQWGSSDQDRDSDYDGHSDSTEVFGGSDPTDATSTPRSKTRTNTTSFDTNVSVMLDHAGGATNLTGDSATLQGTVTLGEDVLVKLGWGPVDLGTNLSLCQNTESLGTWDATQSVAQTVTGLTNGTTND
ncbi:MAG: hypothetical protein AAF492_29400, partial [Verrucomicrobiota bacterium]